MFAATLRSFGKHFHEGQLAIYALMALSVLPAGAAWSVDARWLRRLVRWPERQRPDTYYAWAVYACCAAIGVANRDCYRAQSFATARGIAHRLGLAGERWSVAFQSRLGRIPWIRPFTDEVLDELAAKGVRRLAVYCPAFVADCLETLEEIGIRAREQWRGCGGDDLLLVPSLNASPVFAATLASIIRRRA